MCDLPYVGSPNDVMAGQMTGVNALVPAIDVCEHRAMMGS
jgi:hypothetical protein